MENNVYVVFSFELILISCCKIFIKQIMCDAESLLFASHVHMLDSLFLVLNLNVLNLELCFSTLDLYGKRLKAEQAETKRHVANQGLQFRTSF